MEAVENFQHMLTGAGVQCAGGLVGHDDGRAGGDGSGDGRPLLLSAGHLGGFVLGPVQQIDPLLSVLHQIPPLGAQNPLIEQGEFYVFPHIQGGNEVVALEDEANLFVADVG